MEEPMRIRSLQQLYLHTYTQNQEEYIWEDY